MSDRDRAKKWLDAAWDASNIGEAVAVYDDVDGLAAEFAAVRAEARREALEEAAALCIERRFTDNVSAYGMAYTLADAIRYLLKDGGR